MDIVILYIYILKKKIKNKLKIIYIKSIKIFFFKNKLIIY